MLHAKGEGMTRTSRVHRRLSVAVVALLAAGLVPLFAGVANAAGSNSYSISTKGSVRVGGKPYRMRMNVFKSRSGASLSLTFTRNKTTTTATMTQTHSYSFSLPRTDVTIDPTDLVPTKVHTNTHLKKFGSINMTLRNYGKLSKRTFRCPKPHRGIVLGSSARGAAPSRGRSPSTRTTTISTRSRRARSPSW